jgi:hypothetical protein
MDQALGGKALLLTWLLNSVIWIVSFMIWGRSEHYGGLRFFSPFICSSIWICQFLYLIPIAQYYRSKREWEIVKGISLGAMVTILINGICYPPTRVSPVDLPKIGVVLLTIVIMLITFYAFNRRSRPK